MTRPLVELVEQFCQYQLKQRGKTEGGVQTYRWNLEQFLRFGHARFGRVARVSDLSKGVIQDWMDDMAARDLTLGTIRSRQSTLSSFCSWLVKRELFPANPIAGRDRPPHRIEPPKQVPTPALMDALIEAARKRQRPRDVAVFLILRFSGMRRESVATLQARHLDALWGLRRVRVKGGKTRDIPLPEPVMRYLHAYVAQVLTPSVTTVAPETPLFWSVWGRRSIGKHRAPMTGKNIWRLCKLYGRMIGYPMLKPHDLRHGVAMEVLERRHDLEQVRVLLGHARIDTTQIYTMIRPAQLEASGVVLRGACSADAGEFSERGGIHVRGTFACSSNTEPKTSIDYDFALYLQTVRHFASSEKWVRLKHAGVQNWSFGSEVAPTIISRRGMLDKAHRGSLEFLILFAHDYLCQNHSLQ
jgi:site-specific recombinase XerD